MNEASGEKNVSIAQNTAALFKEYRQWAKREPIVGAMRRGSCGFHNGLSAHGAGTNMTPYPRRAMTCAYMPIGSTFNGLKNILPADYVASLSVGDLLDNDEQNPVVFSN